MNRARIPPWLSAGDTIAVIAPSGGFSTLRFERGLKVLGDRYDVKLGRSIHARDGYLAGSDAQRAGDLQAALEDPSVKAIIAARGGFGATRLLDTLDIALVQNHPKWLVGFSDITALHALWQRAGLASLHGPMVCSLPEASAEVQRDWFDALEGHGARPLRGQGWAGGKATGPLMGGNLAVLSALCGSPYLPSFDGAVLLLEDVGEKPYRLDRMLTTLRQAGVFAHVAGVALGQFTDCTPGDDGTEWRVAVRRNLQRLGVPVVGELPVGHVRDNHPVVLGTEVTLDGDAGRLSPVSPMPDDRA